MRISDVKIMNYRSLHNIELSELGDLTVLIGKNNSGKTSILEILNRFFAEIDNTGVTQGIDQYAWFDGDQDSPVIVRVTIVFNEDEYSAIFPVEFMKAVKDKVDDYGKFTITRNIEKPPVGWRTTEIIWSKFYLMKDGKVSTPEALSEISTPHKVKIVSFASAATKENISGDAVVLVDPDKKAYLFSANAANLVKAGKAEWENVSAKATDWKKYVQENGYALIERQFTENELWELSPFSQQVIQGIISSLTTRIKNRFKLILATRDAWPQNPLVRAPLIDADSQNLLRTVGVADARAEQRRWNKIKTLFEKSFGIGLGIHPSYIAGQHYDLRLPIQNFGGGSQEFLILLRYLTEGDFIFGIEEPEIHLHPDLAQKLFEIFKKLSENNQIFVSTHSTIFVDKAELASTWIVKLNHKETEVKRIEKLDDLKRLLFELGSRPSDIFFSNGLIFVEGESDKLVFPTWAEKMGLRALKEEMSWFATHGKDRGRYYLDVWVDAAETTDLPYFMILDKGAEKEAKAFLKKQLILEENLFLLQKGAIESYYPKEKLLSAFKSEYGIEGEKEAATIEKLDDKEIRELIAKNGKDPSGWKMIIGKKVAESMEAEEIDEEIKRILERVTRILQQKGFT